MTFIYICEFSTGINCTKADLEAIIDGNDDVELLNFEEGRLWYETSYKYVCLVFYLDFSSFISVLNVKNLERTLRTQTLVYLILL